MSWFSLSLRGDSRLGRELPEVCQCGCKKFYKQTDFNRNLGLVVVGIAATFTFILAFQGYPWLVTWSPMPLALLLDFSLAKTRPTAALCYKCGLIYRGVNSAVLESIEDFNLETYDVIKYPERDHA